MTVKCYYNEHEPYAAQWLRNLITAGYIAPGDVDERSIADVRPDELNGYAQCHFFAGIGVWSHALRLAGVADAKPLWTGSCPCQPFSAAGQGKGFADERHLWPAFHHLIEQCRPAIVFGEQVASRDAEPWLDLVQDDLEAMGYAVGAVPFPAAGVGAPHLRDRLYWVAHAEHGEQWRRRGAGRQGQAGHEAGAEPDRCGPTGRVGDDDDTRLEGLGRGPHAAIGQRQGALRSVAEAGKSCGMAAPFDGPRRDQTFGASGSPYDFWRAADWLFCRDGRWRPVEPGTFPLVDGAAARVGRLRAYGNALVAQQARAFIEAYLGVAP